MRVGIRADASRLIGGGHVMRCLTLADALSESGADVTFVAASMPEALRERITRSGHELVQRAELPDLDRTGRNWHEPCPEGPIQLQDATATEAAIGSADWVVVDHYLLDARWHSAARRFASKVLVIDDLANRTYDCHVLVDQNFGRSASDYRGLVPSDAEVLAGATYALLRPEFARERPAALERRKESRRVERILVSMGTTDPGGVSAQIVNTVLAMAPNCAVDLVLGPQAASLAGDNPKATIHVDSDDMAGLMRDADLAIGAAGATSWERCCLGLPSIALVLAENQRPGAEALDTAGAAIAVHSADAIRPALEKLLDDVDARSRMSAACFAITDALGKARVVDAMLGKARTDSDDVNLHNATTDDAETLWLWRNDPVTRAQSRSTRPVPWADHMRWLSFTLADPMRHLFIAESGGAPVGMVRFDPADGGADEVSINVAPDRRGHGLGAAILKAGCAHIRSQRIVASVNKGNDASRRLFESCGFKPAESAEAGFLRYALDVPQRRRKLA